MTRPLPPALMSGVLALAALASACTGLAQEARPETGEEVAAALARAQEAQAHPRHEGLAEALAVIAASGARPLPGWSGIDPVPGWRAQVPDGHAPLRGSPLGPGYRSGQVPGGRSDSFEQLFLSGRKASVALSAPGNAPLSLRVLDAGHNPVCTADDRRACRWVPLFTQRYLIEVRNGGSRVADYFLVVD
jgi:hypothetical protein